MILISKHTRFRSYQLKTKGTSFSYWNGAQFTLCEARFNEDNKHSICHEVMSCKKTKIDVLHITSWDNDHCNPTELNELLTRLKPELIEQPGYMPPTDDGKESAKIIARYCNLLRKSLFVVNPQNVSTLPFNRPWDYTDVHLNNPKKNPIPNDNSSIKLFRNGCFSVLSLGDIEDREIQKDITNNPIIRHETDVLLLSHHGSDNMFNSDSFIEAIKPKAAIALPNWSNRHGHPDVNVTTRLKNHGILYYSTKQGDVIIESAGDHTRVYKIWNYISDGERLELVSQEKFTKKAVQWSEQFK